MLGRFHNLKELDGGGQARIYLADDLQDNKKVILKALKHDNAGSRRRLQREIRLLEEQKSNPFVVCLEGVHLNYSPPFIVLEYCAGGSLANWIVKRRPVRDVAVAMQHAVLGVQGIHAKDGFHRDLTPRNILASFDPDGRWRIKLIDFGLGQTPNAQSGTMTRNWAGTPGYIAPEVEAGDDYTWCSDIFSLGVTFREVLTGSKTKPLFDFNPPPAEFTKLLDEMTDTDPLIRPNTQYIYQKLERIVQKPVEEPEPIRLQQPPQGSGWGWIALAAIGGLATLAANANSYDENIRRYRDSQGRFRSGWLG